MKDNCNRYLSLIRSNLIVGVISALDQIRLEIQGESVIFKSRSQKATNEIDSDQDGGGGGSHTHRQGAIHFFK